MIPGNNINPIPNPSPIPKESVDRSSSTTKKIKFHQCKIGQAKELEDLPKLKNRVKASKSATAEFATKEAHEPLRNKDSVFWKCIARTPGKNGGYLFTFRLRDVYDKNSPQYNSQKTSDDGNALRPAVEYAEYLLDDLPGGFQGSKSTAIMKELGYSVRKEASGTFITLPDKNYLAAKFKELKKTYPDIPIPSIINSAGIAGDREFTEAHLIYNYVLSDSKEFVHDQIGHIYPSILLSMKIMVENRDPTNIVSKTRQKWMTFITHFHQKLEIARFELEKNNLPISEKEREKLKNNLERLQACLGARVDLLPTHSLPMYKMFKDDSEEAFTEDILSTHFHPSFVNVFNRFEKTSMAELRELWEIVCKLEQNFRNERK